MNKSFQFSGVDRNYLASKTDANNNNLSIILQQNPVKQSCGCCDVCQCEQHIGDESFVCPCSPGDGKCCC